MPQCDTLLVNKILPLIFNKGASNFVSCKFNSESVETYHLQSNAIFLTATVAIRGKEKEIPLFAKFEPSKEETRTFFRTGSQFYIEVLMYNKLLPLLERNNIVQDCFVNFYYGTGHGDEKVVVVEDITPRGYKMTKENCFIDYDHLALAIDKLGRFHALSFAAKQESPREFFDLVKRLKEPFWLDGSAYLYAIKACVHRAINPLVEKGKHVEVLKMFLEKIDANFCGLMLEMVAPKEPTAVLCHGDFCRNNMMFEYSQGKPTDVKFIDIATARYSSPMIDLSLFLFLNSSAQVRRDHWDDLLAIYHRALSTAVPGTKVPSLEDLRKEVTMKAFYGLIRSAHFLPVVLFDNHFTSYDVDAVAHHPKERLALELVQAGGDAGTKLMSDMVEELIDRGCLTLQHSFLQSR